MVDENLFIPIKVLQYNRFAILLGMTSRCVGRIKISSQRIWPGISKGKIGELIQFFRKGIRNLTELLGTDAVSGHNLCEKLSDLPFIKPTKPTKP